ncbi:MAG: hypothetical protein GY696_21435 [Gammaproteobacteria bacterium]|nr:hypothetical protein [Gammaproteobacteria bacterium]
MAENKPRSKKQTPKKATAKSSAVKKAAPSKKVPVRKTAAKSGSHDTTRGASSSNSVKENMESSLSVESMVMEMRNERDKRDKQITSLIKEVRQGFADFSDYSVGKDSERDKEMAKLYQSLQGAFSQVKEGEEENKDRSLVILNALSDSIMKDHENTLKEVNEQKKLQDEKIQQLDRIYKRHTGRNRLLAIPGILIGIVAIVYMFYVVTIMEKAMTSMSADMYKMQFAVGNMSNKMDVMSGDTESMSGNMVLLNQNIANMSRDLSILTYNVSPTMKGMRDMMPWMY